jgi:hypothetical protein
MAGKRKRSGLGTTKEDTDRLRVASDLLQERGIAVDKRQLAALLGLKPGCQFIAGGVHGTEARFPVSRDGWSAAYKAALQARDRFGAGYATLVCPTGLPKTSHEIDPGIPLYQCYRGDQCAIESHTGDYVMAGARRTKRRK